MPFNISLKSTEQTFLCREDENVLEGMCRLGKRGIPSGCRGGGCGVCKVSVVSGRYTTRRMSSCHVSDAELREGIVLACRIYPSSDLELEVLGAMKKCVLR